MHVCQVKDSICVGSRRDFLSNAEGQQTHPSNLATTPITERIITDMLKGSAVPVVCPILGIRRCKTQCFYLILAVRQLENVCKTCSSSNVYMSYGITGRPTWTCVVMGTWPVCYCPSSTLETEYIVILFRRGRVKKKFRRFSAPGRR